MGGISSSGYRAVQEQIDSNLCGWIKVTDGRELNRDIAQGGVQLSRQFAEIDREFKQELIRAPQFAWTPLLD
jgi:hypothetical protein